MNTMLLCILQKLLLAHESHTAPRPITVYHVRHQHQAAQVLFPRNKLMCSPCKKLKMYGVGIVSKGILSTPSVTHTGQWFQNLIISYF